MHEHSGANAKWKDQLEDFQQSNACRELFVVDREPFEFEWSIFPALTTLEILQKIQENLDVDKSITKNPEKIEGRILFMSMFNDCSKKGNYAAGFSNFEKVKNYARRFLIPRPRRRKHMVWKAHLTNLKDSGTLAQEHQDSLTEVASSRVSRFLRDRNSGGA